MSGVMAWENDTFTGAGCNLVSSLRFDMKRYHTEELTRGKTKIIY